MKTSKNLRRVLLTVALVAVVACASIGGTIAWLVDSTGPVTNTFTVGDINIDLTETGATNNQKDYKFVPGDTLSKDPKVTVEANSEACWLFVHVAESNNTLPGSISSDSAEKVISWSIANGWTAVPGHAGYYYREVSAQTTAQDFNILAGGTTANQNGQVTVSENVEKGMVAGLNNNKPTLTFTAAAVQKGNVADVNAAWAKLPASFTGASVTP